MGLQVVVNFQVIDETDDWVVVEKPAPLIVHPANKKPEPTLLGGLQNLYAYEIENGACLGIITRLDRETSGIVLVAKHREAAKELGLIFEQRGARKEYLAVVKGCPDRDYWICEERICRQGEIGSSGIWVRQVVDRRGKYCSTSFTVEKRFERNGVRYSVVRCFPQTGRMHQIRVHLAHSGFPIVGDKLYSGDGSEYLEWMDGGWTDQLFHKLLIPRHALHAARLGITWRGQDVEWTSCLPTILENFVSGKRIDDPEDIVIWSRHG